MTEDAKLPLLKMMFLIVDWQRVKKISALFEAEEVRYYFVTKGRGTASSEILDLLGIGASDKAVVFCLEEAYKMPDLLRAARKKLGFHGPGGGIAFTAPLSGINNLILKDFLETSDRQNAGAEEQEGAKMSSEIKHDLIFSIINQGYSDALMTAAREAGATGGTVISARGLASEGSVKFFGVSVQAEREIVIILTTREKKTPIMQAISQACGMNTPAGCIIFSLPVDQVMGLTFD